MTMAGHQLNDNHNSADEAVERLLGAYSIREVMLALARALHVRGLAPLAGKIRAMVPGQ